MNQKIANDCEIKPYWNQREATLINDRPGSGQACVRATSGVQTAEKLKITERSEILDIIGMKPMVQAGRKKRGVEGVG